MKKKKIKTAFLITNCELVGRNKKGFDLEHHDEITLVIKLVGSGNTHPIPDITIMGKIMWKLEKVKIN